nr:pilus assembly protein [Burkholderia multivorans]
MTESRRTRALSDRLIAFHAADAALGACTAALLRGTARDSSARELQGELQGQPQREPTMWQRMPALEHPDAFQPFSDWPMAAQPPRCLIEAWPDADPPDGRAYLITARGVGAQASSAVWLQTQLAVRGGRVVAQRWRRVAALHR